MTLTLYVDVRKDLSGVNWLIPDRANVSRPPKNPLGFGDVRIRVEIEIPEPYNAENLMAYVEEIDVGRDETLIHLPKGGKS